MAVSALQVARGRALTEAVNAYFRRMARFRVSRKDERWLISLALIQLAGGCPDDLADDRAQKSGPAAVTASIPTTPNR